MEYRNHKIEYPVYQTRAFDLYFQGMELGVLDIETTGLSPKNSAFVLGGLVTPQANGIRAEQFFAETLSQEDETLQTFWKAASQKDVLITFNGQHFDLPFMQGRSKETLEFPYHLDLYLLVKQFSPVRKFLPNLKQKTIENFMGLWQYRKDEISGAESVQLYYEYLTGKKPEVLEKILLHNHDDIVQLYRLLKVLEKTNFHEAMFHLGFPVKVSDTYLIVESISLKPEWLRIAGRQMRNPLQYQGYIYNDSPCHIQFSAEDRTFCIDLPILRTHGMALLDLESLGFSCRDLDKYPACQEGFLTLQNQEQLNHLEINHFTKLFIERIIKEWTTNR